VATITVAIRKSAHGSNAALIPASVLKALPQDELLDRLSHAADLATRARDPQLVQAYDLIAKAMLKAQPRDAVAKEIARRYLRAARTPDPVRAEALRRGAIRLIEQNPPAPTRADVAKSRQIAKAKAKASAELVAVYNDKGDLVGTVDPADITPLAEPKPAIGNPASLEPAPPGEAGTPAAVAKAAAQLKDTLYHGTGPEQVKAANAMQAMATAGLAAIHGRGARPRPGP
jgi:hypothetical protein